MNDDNSDHPQGAIITAKAYGAWEAKTRAARLGPNHRRFPPDPAPGSKSPAGGAVKLVFAGERRAAEVTHGSASEHSDTPLPCSTPRNGTSVAQPVAKGEIVAPPIAAPAPLRTPVKLEPPLMDYAAVWPPQALTQAERREQALSGLRHVAALDPSRGAAFISIHRKVTFAANIAGEVRKPSFQGGAHVSLDTALEDAFFWANRGHDVYWAMGGQAKAGERKERAPYPSAIRQGWNTVACRCLYIDIDVKPGAYGSTREAAEALIGFVRAFGLEPTMIVGSGTGGLHVYWRLTQLATPEEFKAMAEALVKAAQAHGLKFDQACTPDICRLLRVPGTWNFKNLKEGETGRPVTLVYIDTEKGDE